MSSLHELYQAHLAVLQQRARQVLTLCSLDGLLIHSGELQTVFFDDQTYPFKVNPQFKAWLPLTQTPGCWLWIDGATRPKLFFNSPSDYWHKVDPLPETYWSDEFDIVALKEGNDLGRLLPLAGKAAAYLGPVTERAKQLGIGTHRVNPKAVIDYLDYYRSFKTDYELCCMREAQKIAFKGHLAARQAFFEGNSELSIHHRYLSVTGQRESTVPYGNIVAINDHAAVLHYTQLESQQPEEARSFLLDAGAEYQGYAADVTRTYARQPGTLFADLVAAINQHQLDLVRTLKVGARYTDYHVQMNQRTAGLLCDTGLLQGISQEALVAENITSAFMPHGIGHQLGLQVHDVAGFMQDDQGSYLSAPEDYPWLRCTRILEPRMVLTIEPGLYFIESLLRPWRNSARSRHFNWQAIDALQPYGGIRIEDNVVIWADRTENMTRDLHLA